MKRNAFKLVLSSLLIVGLAACGKTTKGKLEGEWTVSNYNSTITHSTIQPATTSVMTVSHNGATQTIVNNGITTTEKVLAHTYNFKKDGSWSSVYTIEKNQTAGGLSIKIVEDVTTEGNWNFVAKNKTEEFKKNERVLMTTSSETTKVTNTANGVTTTAIDKETYATQQGGAYFTVENSSKKELILVEEDSYKSVSSNSISSTNRKITLTK